MRAIYRVIISCLVCSIAFISLTKKGDSIISNYASNKLKASLQVSNSTIFTKASIIATGIFSKHWRMLSMGVICCSIACIFNFGVPLSLLVIAICALLAVIHIPLPLKLLTLDNVRVCLLCFGIASSFLVFGYEMLTEWIPQQK